MGISLSREYSNIWRECSAVGILLLLLLLDDDYSYTFGALIIITKIIFKSQISHTTY